MRNHHRYKHAADEDDHVLALNNYAEGFLVKQGRRVKNWKRRYFVFRDGYLSYRKDQRENSRVLGTVVVEDVFYWSGAEFGLALKLSSGRSIK
ncbi:AGC protein kinase [Phytophthora cinnamomi]|uniref:AGC protein kinase n=1 Tax=Phytophthora cinnamomi TaxID=4785 RepID=UPI00355A9DC0|nr:AGC protein kinase [Phytophthora cinnamomi]